MHLTIHSPSATTKDITDFFKKKTQTPATVKLCIPSESYKTEEKIFAASPDKQISLKNKAEIQPQLMSCFKPSGN